MRIKLASWYGDQAPGEVIEVSEAKAKALVRDGLVAEVVADVPPSLLGEAEEPPEAPASEPPRRRR